MLEKILTPVSVRGKAFANRIVMAPMYPFGWLGEAGKMPEKTVDHYLKRADAGIGLLILHALHVLPEASDDGTRSAIYSDEHIPALARIANACHSGKTGTKLFVQLAHSQGGGADIAECYNTMAAEGLAKIRDAFITAALRCEKAGCDGVELHGAHSYWLNTAASRDANRRTDAFGGELPGRLHLARDVIDGIRSNAGKRFIIAYRMGWNRDLQSDRETARALESIGVDMLHVSSGIPEGRALPLPEGFGYNEVVYTGCEVKKAVNIPVIVVNDIRSLRRGEALLEEGQCDFVAYGKPFLADALFAQRGLADPDYQPCLSCGDCAWGTDGDLCPALIAERFRLL
jgi:2,4-dienoyl-CoA reductase-like NADH-dependent reductase (Old Yellow Enzyme family)